MAKLTFLGSANAFYSDFDNFQSNLLITADNQEKFLIDCGGDARRSLTHLSITVN